MAQLRDSIVQGSLRVTDTTYTTNLNLSSASASLSIFTDANKNLVTKSAADAWSALGGDESGQHPDSYFIKAITSTDEVMVRFNGTDGSVQSSRMSMNDNGLITVSYKGQYPGDTQFKNEAGTIVGERWLDQGNGTNVTAPRFYWRVWRPKATADTGVNTQYEQFRLPAASSGTAANATYEILTSKSKVTIAQGGTGLSSADPHKVLIGPNSTAADAPTWRTIVAADLPTATTSALGVMSVSTGLSVSSGAVSVSYGTAANTALQGNATLVTLNGTNKSAASVASFYAPTAAGTSGQYLKSTAGTPEWATFSSSTVGLGNVSNNSKLNGAAGTKGDMIYWSDKDTPARLGIGTANHILIATANGPIWSRNAHIIDESGSSVANKRDELVLGNNTASSSNGSSFGRLALYSENTAGTYLVSASGTAWKTATLQAKDGTIAYTADITSAIQALDGNLNSTTPGAGKTLTAFSQTDGKVSATFGDISITASQAGLGNVSNNSNLNSTTGTKGDIIYWSAANTPSRLAISATGGAILNVASGVPAWTTNYTANELIWYANSSTSTYYYITTDYVSTAEHWFYGTIVGTRGTTSGSTSICTFQIHTNGSGNVNHAQYTDRDFLITNFRVHKDSSNKIIISLTVTNQYSRMRMRLYADNSASYLNYAKSVTTTAPTVSSTYSGIPYWNLTPTNMQYYRGQWGNANTVRMTTNGSIGFPAFAYKNYHLGSSNSFGVPASAVLIETTTNGTASSPTWATGTSALYTDAAKRDIFAFGTTVLPVANLPATDYWNRSSDGVSFTASGTNGTHYRPNIAVGMGIRVTADFTVFLRYLYFSVIEARWLSYYHTTTCKVETYNTANNTWTLIYSEDIVNADTTRYYHLGTEKYVRGNRATNTTDISKVRWTMVVKTLNTAAVPDNARYAPCVGGFNLYGFGMPSNDNSISSRFAYEMARHGQPIYVTSYTAGSGLGAARIPTQDLYIGDDLRSTAANTEKWANLILGNNKNVNTADYHSQGRIYIYSAATAAHVIVGSSTTTEYTHTLPNNTGMIVSLSGSTAKGSGTKPVYVPATGIVTECSTYAGGTAVTLNNASKAASTASFYAPTAGGTAGYVLIGAGTTTAPAWYGGLTLAGTAKANWIATFAGETASTSTTTGAVQIKGGLGVALNIHATKVYNAVWNDYAECRKSWIEEPGRVITEDRSGTMELATQRLMPACKIISDTYGTLMGETETSKTPIAVAGRVLAYPYKDRAQYQLGDAVCSAPNGTVDIMSRDEIMMFPERIIGTVSEIPEYEVWHAGTKDNPTDIEVNGRIWIYVR